MTKQRVQNRDVNAVQRVALALSLRAKKMGYDQIARRCGYGSAAACYNAIQRELQRVVFDNVDELRREEAEGLDRLEEECWQRLQDAEYEKSKLFAVDRILAIKERRAKLFGLDIKSEDAATGPQVIIEEVPSGYLEGPKE